MDKILLIGAGNATHALIPILTNRGFEVNVLTSQDKAIELSNNMIDNDGINAYMPDGSVMTGYAEVHYIPSEAMRGVKTIIFAVPASAYTEILSNIRPYIREDMNLCATTGQGGFNWVAWDILGNNVVERLNIFSLLPMPLNCRIREYGKSVDVMALKENYVYCVYNPTNKKIERAYNVIEDMLGVKALYSGNMGVANLYPINPVLHIGRLYEMFEHTSVLDSNPLFYEDMNEKSILYMNNIEYELHQIAKVAQLPIPTMFEFLAKFVYKDTSSNLLEFFKTNDAYKGIRSPVIEIDGKFELDTNSRYLHEDVTHGLCVYKSIAEICYIDTPFIDKMISFFQEIMGKSYLIEDKLIGLDIDECNIPSNYKIETIEVLLNSC